MVFFSELLLKLASVPSSVSHCISASAGLVIAVKLIKLPSQTVFGAFI